MENYGNGPSTGQIQSGARRISTIFRPEDLHVSIEDRYVLRILAERVAAIAASPIMAEKRELWRKLNSLEKIRPIIFCEPENGWNEIITEKQMMCKGKMARHWEMDLRKEIFWGEEMGDDRPVEPYFYILSVLLPDDWGVEIVEHKTDAQDGAIAWEPPIKDYDKDLDRLKTPRIVIDWETSNSSFKMDSELAGGNWYSWHCPTESNLR